MTGSKLLRSAGLAALALVAIVLCYLAVTRDPEPPASSREPDASVTQSAAPTEGGEPGGEDSPPEVADQLRTDFVTSNELPEGARTFDNSATGSPLAVSSGLLTHESPKARGAVGSLEVQLTAPVQKLGVTIIFPMERPGSVNLVAWSSSLVDAQQAGQPVPPSGLRLEAAVTDWQLTIYDDGGDSVVAGDVFEPPDGPLTFEVYRSGARAWVVDPTGKVTVVDNPSIEALAGPWASWQLTEQSTQSTPAQIQQLWAG